MNENKNKRCIHACMQKKRKRKEKKRRYGVRLHAYEALGVKSDAKQEELKKDNNNNNSEGGVRFGNMKLPDSLEKLSCSLEDLYKGVVKKRRVARNVVASNDALWRPTILEEVLTIEIKPGYKNGTKITYKEKGNQLQGTTPADLIFIVNEKPHSVFKREGNDLVATLKITLVEALTGHTAHVTTLDGRTLTVPISSVITPTHEEVLAGEGMPMHKEPTCKGNLRIKFNIEFPASLTLEQKTGIKQLLSS